MADFTPGIRAGQLAAPAHALRSTRYVIVTGPSGSSLDDAAYLVGELRERSLSASAVLLNRAVGSAPAWKFIDF